MRFILMTAALAVLGATALPAAAHPMRHDHHRRVCHWHHHHKVCRWR